MLTIILQHLLCSCLTWRFAGNSVCNYLSFLAVFFVPGESFNLEGLTNMWKIKILVEFRSDPDLSGFLTTVSGFILSDKVRLPVDIFKEGFDFFEK